MIPARGALEQGQSLVDEASIPGGAILSEQRGQRSPSATTRRKSSGMQTHQRGKGVGFCSGRGRMVTQDLGETDRLTAQLGANGRLGRCAVVPLVEQQVQR